MARGCIPGTRYSTSDFINRFADLAQSSQYRAHLTFPMAMQGYLRAKRIPPTILNESGVLCKATSLPGSSISTHDVRDFYGVTQKHAYARAFDNTIDLTFFIDADYAMLYLFEAWMEFIMPLVNRDKKSRQATYRAQYPEDYRSSLYIHKFNKDKDANWDTVSPFDPRGSIVYEFINAFPQNISSTQVSYDPSSNLEFTVTFAYDRYITDRTSGGASGSAQNILSTSSTQHQALKGGGQDNPSDPNYWDGDNKNYAGVDAFRRAQRGEPSLLGSQSDYINMVSREPGKESEALRDVAIPFSKRGRDGEGPTSGDRILAKSRGGTL